MVFLFHLVNLSGGYIQNVWMRSIAYFGQFGVQFFFVISGFVITYSMINSGFQTRDYFRFLKKRIIRIEPPYLLVLALTAIFLWVRAKSGFGQGNLSAPDWKQLVLHIGYLIPFSSYNWLSIVFWTLAIEFQFYLFFPLIFSYFIRYRLIRYLTISCFAIFFFISHSTGHFFYWSPVFLLGITLALYKKKRISVTEFGFFFLFINIIILYKLGLVVSIFANFPFIMILAELNLKVAVLNFLGKISYSLYLLHTLIAFFIINLGIRYSIFGYRKILVIIFAVSLTLYCSYLLYYYVERPCQKAASSIPYKL